MPQPPPTEQAGAEEPHPADGELDSDRIAPAETSFLIFDPSHFGHLSTTLDEEKTNSSNR